MKLSSVALLISTLLAVVACTAATGPTDQPTSSGETGRPTSGPEDVSRFFTIVEVGVGSQAYVTLVNYTDGPATLDALFLCQAKGCVNLPDVVVEPDGVARIAVGDGAGLENVVMTGANLDLPPSDGEIAIYASEDLGQAENIRAYLQWGSTPHELTRVAVETGIWLETAYAPTGPGATRLWKTNDGLWVWDPG
jgi:hypothetical protein